MDDSGTAMQDVIRTLLERAVSIHGHLGPFLVLGLRMALLAKEVLGDVPCRCEVKTLNKKPFICSVDGMKAVMGCNGIDVENGEGLAAVFRAADGREVSIEVRDSTLKKNAKVTWEMCEKYAHDVMVSKDEELFHWSEFQ
jgi:formylmethanofuran dehydrogenase subunit E